MQFCNGKKHRLQGVYRITNIVTGKCYIGSSNNVYLREKDHFNRLKRGKHANKYLQRSYINYGEENFRFEVVELVEDSVFLRAREQAWFSRVNPGYNLKSCAWGNETNRGLGKTNKNKSEALKKLWATPEYRENAVKARKGMVTNKGYKCTPEQIENRRRAARISNMKRKGADWKEFYIRFYPEHKEDIL